MKPSIRFLAAALVLLGALALRGRAQTVITTWNGSALNGDFADAANWSAGLPYFQGGEPGTNVGFINNGDTVALTTVLPAELGTIVDFLHVGGASHSTLDIQSTGSLYAVLVSFGTDAGTTGSGTVTGILDTAFGINVGDAGSGSLSVGEGGIVRGIVNVGASPGGTGSFTLYSGASMEDSIGMGNSGSITTGDGDATIVLHGGSQISGSISVGGAGTTTLTTTNGIFTLGGNLSLGAAAGGTVTAHLDGTTLGPAGLLINGDGANSLLVDNGATLTMTNAVVSEIGGSGSGSNEMTVSGAGTTWTNTGDLLIGGTGYGVLTITDTASVSQQQITLGGSESGTGTLNLTSGGTLTAQNFHIGSSSGSGGEVMIDGAGSELHVTTDFTIGGNGYGNVTVSNGGSLRNDGEAYVAITGGGSATVTGAGSIWTSGDNITLAAGGGSGAITLADGGLLRINGGSGHLYLNTAAAGTGFLNIGADAGSSTPAVAGELEAASVAGSTSGSAIVAFNHTGTSGSPYFFAPAITGGIFVVQKAGYTVLTGNNNYTGGNYISGGTLSLGANDAIGPGDIALDGGTLNLNGFVQTSGMLTVTDHSYLDFNGTSSLTLANLTFTGNAWLDVANFDAGVDFFQVGTSLTGDQLSRINFGGFSAIMNEGYLSAGSSAFTAPIPEPSTYAALAGIAALGVATWCRRARFAVATARRL